MSTYAFDNTAERAATARSTGGFLQALGAFGAITATFAGVAFSQWAVVAPQAQAQPNVTRTLGTFRSTERSMAATCDNPAFANHVNIMFEPAVEKFLERTPDASARAVQRIFELAMARFGHVPLLQTVLSFEELEDGPALFVSLDTRGMDFDEQLRREVDLSEAIFDDPALTATNRRVVLTVV